VFVLVYLVIDLSYLGSLWLLLGTTERMGIARTPEGYAALYAWMGGVAWGAILWVRSELKWRSGNRCAGTIQ
jgi:hypothetical protein